MPELDDIARWISSWPWDSAAPTLIAAILGAGIAVLLSRGERKAASRQRAIEAEENREARASDIARQVRDRRRELVASVLVELGNMLGVASTAKTKSESRVAAATFQLRASALRLEATPEEQDDLEFWAIDVHESYLGVDDASYKPDGRAVIDHARPVIALATEQIIQWERGDATSAELRLWGWDATTRFFGSTP